MAKKARKAKKKVRKKASARSSSDDTIEIIDSVNTRLRDLGFVETSMPGFGKKDLEIPFDITKLGPQMLGQIYSRYARLCEYVHGVVGGLELERIAAEASYSRAKARALSSVEQRGSVAERKAAAEAHPDTLRALNFMSKAEGCLKKGREMLEGYRVQLAALSREITRRERIEPLIAGEDNLDARGTNSRSGHARRGRERHQQEGKRRRTRAG